jgi:hypothetical protein
LTREVAGTTVVQLMVAVVFVVVTVTKLIQDCAKAEGVTSTTSSEKTKIQRARKF